LETLKDYHFLTCCKSLSDHDGSLSTEQEKANTCLLVEIETLNERMTSCYVCLLSVLESEIVILISKLIWSSSFCVYDFCHGHEIGNVTVIAYFSRNFLSAHCPTLEEGETAAQNEQVVLSFLVRQNGSHRGGP
jgi:hypothetical protein